VIHGTCTYVCMCTSLKEAANYIMLKFYLWHDFYNIVFKITQVINCLRLRLPSPHSNTLKILGLCLLNLVTLIFCWEFCVALNCSCQHICYATSDLHTWSSIKLSVIKFFSTCLVLYNVRTEYASTISLHAKYIIMVSRGHCTFLSFFL
jgi:hypothetical protein